MPNQQQDLEIEYIPISEEREFIEELMPFVTSDDLEKPRTTRG